LLGLGFFRGNEGVKEADAARGDRSSEFFIASLVLLLKGSDFAPEIFGSKKVPDLSQLRRKLGHIRCSQRKLFGPNTLTAGIPAGLRTC